VFAVPRVKHEAVSSKSKDWLALMSRNICKWGDLSICGLAFHWIL